MSNKTKIIIAILGVILIAGGITAFCVYQHKQHKQEIQRKAKYASSLEEYEYATIYGIYSCFILGQDIVEQLDNVINNDQVKIEKQKVINCSDVNEGLRITLDKWKRMGGYDELKKFKEESGKYLKQMKDNKSDDDEEAIRACEDLYQAFMKIYGIVEVPTGNKVSFSQTLSSTYNDCESKIDVYLMKTNRTIDKPGKRLEALGIMKSRLL